MSTPEGWMYLHQEGREKEIRDQADTIAPESGGKAIIDLLYRTVTVEIKEQERRAADMKLGTHVPAKQKRRSRSRNKLPDRGSVSSPESSPIRPVARHKKNTIESDEDEDDSTSSDFEAPGARLLTPPKTKTKRTPSKEQPSTSRHTGASSSRSLSPFGTLDNVEDVDRRSPPAAKVPKVPKESKEDRERRRERDSHSKENKPSSGKKRKRPDEETSTSAKRLDVKDKPGSSSNGHLDRKDKPGSSSNTHLVDGKEKQGGSSNAHPDRKDKPGSSSNTHLVDGKEKQGGSSNAHPDRKDKPGSSSNAHLDRKDKPGGSSNGQKSSRSRSPERRKSSKDDRRTSKSSSSSSKRRESTDSFSSMSSKESRDNVDPRKSKDSKTRKDSKKHSKRRLERQRSRSRGDKSRKISSNAAKTPDLDVSRVIAETSTIVISSGSETSTVMVPSSPDDDEGSPTFPVGSIRTHPTLGAAPPSGTSSPLCSSPSTPEGPPTALSPVPERPVTPSTPDLEFHPTPPRTVLERTTPPRTVLVCPATPPTPVLAPTQPTTMVERPPTPPKPMLEQPPATPSPDPEQKPLPDTSTSTSSGALEFEAIQNLMSYVYRTRPPTAERVENIHQWFDEVVSRDCLEKLAMLPESLQERCMARAVLTAQTSGSPRDGDEEATRRFVLGVLFNEAVNSAEELRAGIRTMFCMVPEIEVKFIVKVPLKRMEMTMLAIERHSSSQAMKKEEPVEADSTSRYVEKVQAPGLAEAATQEEVRVETAPQKAVLVEAQPTIESQVPVETVSEATIESQIPVETVSEATTDSQAPIETVSEAITESEVLVEGLVERLVETSAEASAEGKPHAEGEAEAEVQAQVGEDDKSEGELSSSEAVPSPADNMASGTEEVPRKKKKKKKRRKREKEAAAAETVPLKITLRKSTDGYQCTELSSDSVPVSPIVEEDNEEDDATPPQAPVFPTTIRSAPICSKSMSTMKQLIRSAHVDGTPPRRRNSRDDRDSRSDRDFQSSGGHSREDPRPDRDFRSSGGHSREDPRPDRDFRSSGGHSREDPRPDRDFRSSGGHSREDPRPDRDFRSSGGHSREDPRPDRDFRSSGGHSREDPRPDRDFRSSGGHSREDPRPDRDFRSSGGHSREDSRPDRDFRSSGGHSREDPRPDRDFRSSGGHSREDPRPDRDFRSSGGHSREDSRPDRDFRSSGGPSKEDSRSSPQSDRERRSSGSSGRDGDRDWRLSPKSGKHPSREETGTSGTYSRTSHEDSPWNPRDASANPRDKEWKQKGRAGREARREERGPYPAAALAAHQPGARRSTSREEQEAGPSRQYMKMPKRKQALLKSYTKPDPSYRAQPAVRPAERVGQSATGHRRKSLPVSSDENLEDVLPPSPPPPTSRAKGKSKGPGPVGGEEDDDKPGSPKPADLSLSAASKTNTAPHPKTSLSSSSAAQRVPDPSNRTTNVLDQIMAEATPPPTFLSSPAPVWRPLSRPPGMPPVQRSSTQPPGPPPPRPPSVYQSMKMKSTSSGAPTNRDARQNTASISDGRVPSTIDGIPLTVKKAPALPKAPAGTSPVTTTSAASVSTPSSTSTSIAQPVTASSATTSPARASLATASSARPSLATASSARPSLATASSARPSLATASSARPSLATASSARPSLATASSARPSLATASSARASLATASSARASLATTSSVPVSSAPSSAVTASSATSATAFRVKTPPLATATSRTARSSTPSTSPVAATTSRLQVLPSMPLISPSPPAVSAEEDSFDIHNAITPPLPSTTSSAALAVTPPNNATSGAAPIAPPRLSPQGSVRADSADSEEEEDRLVIDESLSSKDAASSQDSTMDGSQVSGGDINKTLADLLRSAGAMDDSDVEESVVTAPASAVAPPAQATVPTGADPALLARTAAPAGPPPAQAAAPAGPPPTQAAAPAGPPPAQAAARARPPPTQAAAPAGPPPAQAAAPAGPTPAQAAAPARPPPTQAAAPAGPHPTQAALPTRPPPAQAAAPTCAGPPPAQTAAPFCQHIRVKSAADLGLKSYTEFAAESPPRGHPAPHQPRPQPQPQSNPQAAQHAFNTNPESGAVIPIPVTQQQPVQLARTSSTTQPSRSPAVDAIMRTTSEVNPLQMRLALTSSTVDITSQPPHTSRIANNVFIRYDPSPQQAPNVYVRPVSQSQPSGVRPTYRSLRPAPQGVTPSTNLRTVIPTVTNQPMQQQPNQWCHPQPVHQQQNLQHQQFIPQSQPTQGPLNLQSVQRQQSNLQAVQQLTPQPLPLPQQIHLPALPPLPNLQISNEDLPQPNHQQQLQTRPQQQTNHHQTQQNQQQELQNQQMPESLIQQLQELPNQQLQELPNCQLQELPNRQLQELPNRQLQEPQNQQLQDQQNSQNQEEGNLETQKQQNLETQEQLTSLSEGHQASTGSVLPPASQSPEQRDLQNTESTIQSIFNCDVDDLLTSPNWITSPIRCTLAKDIAEDSESSEEEAGLGEQIDELLDLCENHLSDDESDESNDSDSASSHSESFSGPELPTGSRSCPLKSTEPDVTAKTSEDPKKQQATPQTSCIDDQTKDSDSNVEAGLDKQFDELLDLCENISPCTSPVQHSTDTDSDESDDADCTSSRPESPSRSKPPTQSESCHLKTPDSDVTEETSEEPQKQQPTPQSSCVDEQTKDSDSSVEAGLDKQVDELLDLCNNISPCISPVQQSSDADSDESDDADCTSSWPESPRRSKLPTQSESCHLKTPQRDVTDETSEEPQKQQPAPQSSYVDKQTNNSSNMEAGLDKQVDKLLDLCVNTSPGTSHVQQSPNDNSDKSDDADSTSSHSELSSTSSSQLESSSSVETPEPDVTKKASESSSCCPVDVGKDSDSSDSRSDSCSDSTSDSTSDSSSDSESSSDDSDDSNTENDIDEFLQGIEAASETLGESREFAVGSSNSVTSPRDSAIQLSEVSGSMMRSGREEFEERGNSPLRDQIIEEDRASTTSTVLAGELSRGSSPSNEIDGEGDVINSLKTKKMQEEERSKSAPATATEDEQSATISSSVSEAVPEEEIDTTPSLSPSASQSVIMKPSCDNLSDPTGDSSAQEEKQVDSSQEPLPTETLLDIPIDHGERGLDLATTEAADCAVDVTKNVEPHETWFPRTESSDSGSSPEPTSCSAPLDETNLSDEDDSIYDDEDMHYAVTKVVNEIESGHLSEGSSHAWVDPYLPPATPDVRRLLARLEEDSLRDLETEQEEIAPEMIDIMALSRNLVNEAEQTDNVELPPDLEAAILEGRVEQAYIAIDGTSKCVMCDNAPKFVCQGCCVVSYCSQEHAALHWEKDHAENCRKNSDLHKVTNPS